MALNFSEDNLDSFLRLDFDEEEYAELEEEMLSGQDPFDLIDAHRQEMTELRVALEELSVIKKEYDPAIHARQAVEEGFLRALYLTYKMSRRFHPLSSYGKKLIGQAERLRKNYEKNYSPLITAITADNIDMFTDFMSDDIAESVLIGDLQAFGVFRTDFDDPGAVAVCAWRRIDLFDDEDGLSPIIDIKWLYVTPLLRNRGIADQIMGELVGLLVREGGGSLAISFVPTENYEIIIRFLLEWGFEFDAGLTQEFRCRTGELDIKEEYKKAAEGITALSSVSEKERKVLFENYLKKTGIKIPGIKLDGDYYDADLSCFAGNADDSYGILLAHKKPSGDISVELIDWEDESFDIPKSLISYFLLSAKDGKDADTFITIRPDSEETEELLDEMVPHQLTAPCVDATLMPPSPDEDMTEDEVTTLIAGVI